MRVSRHMVIPDIMQIRVRAPASAAVVAPWYLSGGVGTGDCVVAYQPKGAASLVASYVNLNAPGTYNATVGSAPTWDAATGWTFDGIAQYLMVGIAGGAYPAYTETWSAVVRVVSWNRGTNKTPWGEYQTGARSFCIVSTGANGITFWHNGSKAITSAITSGVLGMAGPSAYIDGSPVATITQAANTAIREMWIGALNSAGYYNSVTIPALAIYSRTLSDAEMAAISIAMAAL